MSTTTTHRPASQPQIDLIKTIGREARQMAGTDENRNALLDIFRDHIQEHGYGDAEQASGWINALKECKRNWREEDRAKPRTSRAAAATTASEPDAGMYCKGDTIYRVYLGQKSGRMLVKQLVGDETHGYSYEYLGAAAYRLPQDASPLPLEEAKKFGRMTGTCCVCARRLDNPESVDAGIGPVCAGRMEDGSFN